MQQFFNRLEEENNLPQGLLDSVWSAESARGKYMRSPAGAQGHFQFMPPTAQQYGVKDPYNLEQSAQGAARMFGDLSRKYNGDIPRMLAAYNWGQGNLDRKGLNNAPAETQQYIAKIAPALQRFTPPQVTAASMQTAAPNLAQRAMGMVRDAVAPPAYAEEVPPPQQNYDYTKHPLYESILREYQQQQQVATQNTAQPATDVDYTKHPLYASILKDYQQQAATSNDGMLANLGNGTLNLAKGVGMGLADGALGIGYLGAAGIDKVAGTDLATPVSNFNQSLEDYYQKSTPGSWAAGAGRVVGNLFNPAAELALASRAGKALKAVNNPWARTAIATGTGAVTGALATKTKDDSLLLNSALGATLGGSGQFVAPYAKAALQPIRTLVGGMSEQVKQATQRALNAGYQLDIGTMLNNKPLQTFASVLDNLPFTSGRGVLMRENNANVANRAIGETIGLVPDPINGLTAEAAQAQQKMFGKSMGNALSGMQLDPAQGEQLFDRIGKISQIANTHPKLGLKGDNAVTVNKMFNDVLDSFADDLSMNGNKYQDALDDIEKNMGNNRRVNRFAAKLKGALNNAFKTANADATEQFQKARLGYKTAGILDEALGTVTDGNVPAKSLLRKIASNFENYTDKNGKLLPIVEHSRIAASVLGNKIPDSGTAQRTLMQNLVYEKLPAAVGLGVASWAGIKPVLIGGGLGVAANQWQKYVSPKINDAVRRSILNPTGVNNDTTRSRIVRGLLENGNPARLTDSISN